VKKYHEMRGKLDKLDAKSQHIYISVCVWFVFGMLIPGSKQVWYTVVR